MTFYGPKERKRKRETDRKKDGAGGGQQRVGEVPHCRGHAGFQGGRLLVVPGPALVASPPRPRWCGLTKLVIFSYFQMNK
jgi:hypothetical protein